MNKPLNKSAYQRIREILSDKRGGQVRALSYIRRNHAENFEVAKLVLADIVNGEIWTLKP